MGKSSFARAGSLAVIIALLPGAAAFAGEGFYLGAEMGGNFVRDQTLKDEGGNPASSGGAHYDSGYLGGIAFGWTFANGLRPELEWDYRRNALRTFEPSTGGFLHTDGNLEVSSVMLNLWYEVRQPSGAYRYIHPYLGLGIGGVRVSVGNASVPGYPPPPEDYASVVAGQVGAGLGVDLTDRLSLSVDYRWVHSDKVYIQIVGGNPRDNYDAMSGQLGLRYSFGEVRPEVQVSVERRVEVVQPVPMQDRCAIDSDNDGVPDCRDHCPNTPLGFKVDASGCIVHQTVILRAVNFEFDSDRLTQPAMATLDQVALGLQGQPELYISIDGHTDSVGGRKYNLDLSARRAAAVRTYLISRGVNGANLKSEGFGMARPLADNSTPEGRAENRRVEFVVLTRPLAVKVIPQDSTPESKSAAKRTEPPRIQENLEKSQEKVEAPKE